MFEKHQKYEIAVLPRILLHGLSRLVVVFSCFLIGGCAFIPGHIKTSELRTAIGISTEPPRLVNPQFQVQLGEIRDKRRDKGFIGNIRNKLGMVTASITSDPNISDTIRDVLLAELGRKGISVGPSPFILDVDIRKVFIDTVGATYSDVLAEVEIEVSLSLRDTGGLVWSNTYGGKATTGVHQIDRQFLVEVTADAIREVARAIKQDQTVMKRLEQYARASNEPRQTKKELQEILIGSDVDNISATRTSHKRNAYAVVIGIDQYREKLPKADFAGHDAKMVSAYLAKVMGYPEENIATLVNERATRTDIEKYIESWLPNRVEKDATIFVYFSGHGAPNPTTGDAYLVPYDGDPSFVDRTGYPLKRLYESLGKLPAKEVVVMLDSCFSGAGGRSVIAQGTRPMVLSVENPILASGKTVVLAASAGDQVSSTYQQKSHGLLTYFFLKGLQGEADQNKDGSIELAELYEYLKPQVSQVARREFNNDQTPQLIGSSDILKRGIKLVERSAH